MKWLQEMRATKSAATIRRYLSTIRKWMKWAGEGMPLPNYRPPRLDPQLPHPLPGLDADLDRLVDGAERQELRALVALQGFCGLRLMEALTTRPSDFNLQDMTLYVRGKGGKNRIVPVSERAWQVLLTSMAERLGSDDLLVPLRDRNGRRLITELGARVGIKRPISSHDLRATYATCALRECNNIHTVAVLLGHSDVKTTMVYVLATEEDKRKAAGF